MKISPALSAIGAHLPPADRWNPYGFPSVRPFCPRSADFESAFATVRKVDSSASLSVSHLTQIHENDGTCATTVNVAANLGTKVPQRLTEPLDVKRRRPRRSVATFEFI